MKNVHKGQPVATRGKPLEESRGVAVMLHGRDRDTDDILALADRISNPHFAYLAPAAEGNTWYPYRFIEPIEKNEPRLSHALAVCDELVNMLIGKGFARRQIVLAGFSQGACLAAEYAIRNPGRYGGLLFFTGGLIGPPGTTWEREDSFEGTPAFFGTMDEDPFVPKDRVQESARVFERMGADVVERVYPGMEHVVNDDEISVARQILRRVSGD